MRDCPHRPPCPGCPRFGEPGIDPVVGEALRGLARRHGLGEPAVVAGAALGFRHRARLAIRGRLGSPKVGLFEFGTHRVVHIPNCQVQHPLINRVAGAVRRALVEARIPSYSDQAHLGLARYLQVVVERGSQTAQVVLVANADASAPLARCLELIREELDGGLHSLWFNAHCDRSNSVLGPHFERWCGPETVAERFGGAAVHYPPGAFGQSNLEVAQRIIEHLREQIPHDSCVTEFYAGVGAIGLSVIDRARELRLNESSPHALHGLEHGLAGLEAPQRAKVTLRPGQAGAMRDAAAGADVVIVDPPRKGLDPELAQRLAERPPERLFYVSCALDSLQEDILRLSSERRLRLVGLTVFDMFPYTAHVETVARFERA
jgi:tRNA/tmRNA/rRNA uracil-C5-methylase (TrmA/RlmC/RlmD family)